MSERCEWHLEELMTYSPVGFVAKKEEKVWLMRDSFDILLARRFLMTAPPSLLFLGEGTESDKRPPVVVTPSSSPLPMQLLQLTSRAGGMSTMLSFIAMRC